MIDVTGIDKVEFAKAVYRLSVPVGLGILHAVQGDLDDETAKEIASAEDGLSMDYVHGRGCKMRLSLKDGRLMAPDSWYDHTDKQYDELLSQFGISRTTTLTHGCSCECSACKSKPRNRYPDWEKANAAPRN